MLVQFKNPALIKPQSFPNGIATLDGGIERADARVVAMNKLAIDVDHQIAVSFVEFLQHEMAKNESGTQGYEFNLRDLRSFLISSFPDCPFPHSVQVSGSRSRYATALFRVPNAPRQSGATTKSVASRIRSETTFDPSLISYFPDSFSGHLVQTVRMKFLVQ